MKPLFKIIEQPKQKYRSERDAIFQDIYAVYTSDRQRVFRKKENWKRYIAWLKENRLRNSKENQEKFKKHKTFIKELPLKRLAVLLSRNKKQTLYQILSEAKDMDRTGKNAGAYIISNRFI